MLVVVLAVCVVGSGDGAVGSGACVSGCAAWCVCCRICGVY